MMNVCHMNTIVSSLHGELLGDLTWIDNPNSIILALPPLHDALRRDVLRTDDVVEIVEYLVDRNPTLMSSRDQDGSLPLHVACHRGASFTIIQFLVNRNKASVKSVTPQGDLPLFMACEMPETSLDTIFLLLKLSPDVVLMKPEESMREYLQFLVPKTCPTHYIQPPYTKEQMQRYIRFSRTNT